MTLKFTLGTATALAVACIGLFCINAQTWSMVWSNSYDGWKGPVAVCEISADGRITKTIPVPYQPFNTNTHASRFTNQLWTAQTNTLRAYDDKGAFRTTNGVSIVNFVENGSYCAAKGFHKWHSSPRLTTGLDDNRYRECVICGKGETQRPGDWK